MGMERTKSTMMSRTSNKTLLVDSGFFFALLDPRDQHHAAACETQDWLEMHSLIIPWPILCETINTRFTRRPETIARFESIIRAPGTEYLDDSPYRLGAYKTTLAQAKSRRNAMSLVDLVLCAILADTNVRIDAMLTFNFRDFRHICYARKVELPTDLT